MIPLDGSVNVPDDALRGERPAAGDVLEDAGGPVGASGRRGLIVCLHGEAAVLPAAPADVHLPDCGPERTALVDCPDPLA